MTDRVAVKYNCVDNGPSLMAETLTISWLSYPNSLRLIVSQTPFYSTYCTIHCELQPFYVKLFKRALFRFQI